MRQMVKRVVRQFPMLILAAALLLTASVTSVTAATIFESATLGPTGVEFADVANGAVPGTNINPSVFTGVRFELSQPIVTSQVGGHFVQRFAGDFFGAIVRLDDANDFPNSGDFSTSDVLGAAKLTFPNPSAVVLADLNLSLTPGWYALVFGSGLFGTNGGGAALRNGADVGSPTYIAYQPGSGVTWIDITSIARNHTFFVNGTLVPEPATFFASFWLLGAATWLRRKKPE